MAEGVTYEERGGGEDGWHRETHLTPGEIRDEPFASGLTVTKDVRSYTCNEPPKGDTFRCLASGEGTMNMVQFRQVGGDIRLARWEDNER